MKQKRQAKVDRWKNGCGATIGRATVLFTGLERKDWLFMSIRSNVELVYVQPDRQMKKLVEVWVENRNDTNLRNAVKQARRTRLTTAKNIENSSCKST